MVLLVFITCSVHCRLTHDVNLLHAADARRGGRDQSLPYLLCHLATCASASLSASIRGSLVVAWSARPSSECSPWIPTAHPMKTAGLVVLVYLHLTYAQAD
jgi:hypothetical protein